MKTKQNARSAWLAHFSSFSKRFMHLSTTNYKSITQHTEPLRTLSGRRSSTNDGSLLAENPPPLYLFTLVFQRELNNFTLLAAARKKKIFFNLEVKEIPHCSPQNVKPPVTWVTLPGQIM